MYCINWQMLILCFVAIEFATGNKTDDEIVDIKCQDEERPLDTPAIVAM